MVKKAPPRTLDRIAQVNEILYLTTAEISWLFNADVSTVRRYIKGGALEAVILPRDPRNLAEANGAAPERKTKEAYRVRKTVVADHLHMTVDEINAKLVEYYKAHPTRRERRKIQAI